MPIFTFHSPDIFYQINGKGLPVVLLHGFCEDHRVWEMFYDRFSDCQLICIDLPGFGQSTLANIPDLMHYADMIAALLRKIDVNKCILIGHSMGGYISLAFAEKYEHMLLGLGLFHSSPYPDAASKKEKRNKEIQFIERNGHQPYIAQIIPKLFPTDYPADPIINQLINRAQQYNLKGIQHGLEAMMNRPDRSLILENLSCPFLVVAGEKDIVVPINKSIQFASLPDISVMHFLPDVAHMGMFEVPEKCVDIFAEFIDFCR